MLSFIFGAITQYKRYRFKKDGTVFFTLEYFRRERI